MRRIASALAALLMVAGLIPAGILIAERIAFESARNSVLLIVDEPALREAASNQGIAPLELFERYREHGVLGVAIVEQTLGDLADSGEVAILAAAQANAILAIAAPETPPLPAGGVLATDRTGGTFVAQAVAKTGRSVGQVALGGQIWSVFDFDPRTLPAGPDLVAVRLYHEAGALIAYRPTHHPSLARVGDDWPAEARYIIHSGTRAAGFPALLDQTIAASMNRVTAIIEATPQPGVDRIARAAPAAKLFSIVEAWQTILPPEETASKFRLAAAERGNHLLYVRPYETAAATERYLSTLSRLLQEAGLEFGAPDALEYAPSAALRTVASLGVAGGLLALAVVFPGALLGAAIALGLAAVAVAGAGPNFAAPAMLASVVFPVLALTHRTPGWAGLLRTYALTLIGAALLIAIGTDRLAMLAVTPFRGVQATLLGPPLLVALWAVIRSGALRVGLERLWKHPVKLGEAVVAVAILGALAVIVLRRGNLGPLSPTSLELSLREVLSENLVRPRFKELAANPALVLAVFGRWGEPAWAVLLAVAAIGQSSILNTFSHYHTPVLISLQRTLNGAVIGTALGFIALALIGWAIRTWRERQPRRPADRA
jgi:hypothetical protein